MGFRFNSVLKDKFIMSHYSFIFPGQGSQHLGMIQDLYDRYTSIQTIFTQASDILNYNLWDIITHDENKLNDTLYTQPALLVCSYALFQILKEKQVMSPNYMAGHSLGEYSALLCAESLTFPDALQLVQFRAQAMKNAVSEGTGAMAAIIGIDKDKINEICQTLSNNEHIVMPVNYNSKEQTVIAGHKKAVLLACEALKNANAKRAIMLPVSVPSHCPLMLPASEELHSFLKEITIHEPTIPVINNVDVSIETDPEKIKSALVRQLYSPVRWLETILYLQELNNDTLIEVGPNKVLTTLNKRIDKTIQGYSVHDESTLETILTRIKDM